MLRIGGARLGFTVYGLGFQTQICTTLVRSRAVRRYGVQAGNHVGRLSAGEIRASSSSSSWIIYGLNKIIV